MTGGETWRSLLAIGAVTGLALVGCGTPSDRAATPAVRSAQTGAPAPTDSATASSAAPIAPVRVVRLRIPALDLDTAVERLRVGPAGRLRPPRDPDRPGWFPGSPVPGDLGAAVLAGHRDSRTGPAVFWRLADLSVGDSVVVGRSDGQSARFRVVDVRRVPRARFPTADVYGPMPDRALRLITCGGLYDHVRGRYRDNVLVLALAV